jgi:hypothetical protein
VLQSYLHDYDYSRRFFDFSRILTFNNAGHGQRSLRGWRFGLRLRGGSGLPGGWRSFLFRHHCGGFISLPEEICRFPAEYTGQLSIKFDYHIKYYSGRLNTYRLDRTTVTVGALRMLAMSTSPASAVASSCASTTIASAGASSRASVATAPSAASSAAVAGSAPS